MKIVLIRLSNNVSFEITKNAFVPHPAAHIVRFFGQCEYIIIYLYETIALYLIDPLQKIINNHDLLSRMHFDNK